jgi:ABC-type dipeptide/oligopeptide/nickel transport system ATPase component
VLTRQLFSPRHPYTEHLIASLPRIGDSTPRKALEGNPPIGRTTGRLPLPSALPAGDGSLPD